MFEALDEGEIVRIVRTQETEQPESDEDEHDNFVGPSLNLGQAIEHVRQLCDYAVADPQHFGTEEARGLGSMLSTMQKPSLHTRKQATLAGLWGR